MNHSVHLTYFEALRAVLGTNTQHYFTATEFTGRTLTSSSASFQEDVVDAHDFEEGTAVTNTLLAYALDDGTVAGVAVAVGDAHMGFILMHYEHNGDIVRFVAFPG